MATKTLNVRFYTRMHVEEEPVFNSVDNKSGFEEIWSAPTQQMAMRWLRELHKIVIIIYPLSETIYENTTYTIYICTSSLSRKEGHLRGIWKTYEEAVEAALKYVLDILI